MTSRPAPLGTAPDPRAWLARRNSGEPSSTMPERTELVLVDLAACAPLLFEIESETPRVSDEDEARIARLSNPDERRERRAAHIALRIMLERFAGARVRKLPFRLSAHGKPFLEFTSAAQDGAPAGAGSMDPPHFSLSHTTGRALICVSTWGPVGVDLEHHRSPRIMGERRSAIERAGVELAGGVPLPEHDRDARFLTAWVRLEAIAKADGAGLGAHLSIILGRRSAGAQSGAGKAGPALRALDLPMPQGTYAALAGPLGLNVPEWQAFPVSQAGIEALIQENAK